MRGVLKLAEIIIDIALLHRCLIPECDQDGGQLVVGELQPSWLPLAVPLADGAPDPCRRFVAVAPAGLDDNTCSAETFSNLTQDCAQWVYPNKELSIMTEVRTKLYAGMDWNSRPEGLGRLCVLPVSHQPRDLIRPTLASPSLTLAMHLWPRPASPLTLCPRGRLTLPLIWCAVGPDSVWGGRRLAAHAGRHDEQHGPRARAPAVRLPVGQVRAQGHPPRLPGRVGSHRHRALRLAQLLVLHHAGVHRPYVLRWHGQLGPHHG